MYVQKLQLDCGSEHISDKFQQYLVGIGYKHEITTPYILEQNRACE